MADLGTLVKVLMGRELAGSEIRKAREGVTEEGRGFHTLKTTEYSMQDGKPVVVKSLATLQTTQDVSRAEVLHTEFYNDRTETCFYTPDGLLEEKVVQTGSTYTLEPTKFTAIKYEPPGSWKGKRISKTERKVTTYK